MLSGSRASRETCNLCICFHKKQSQGRSQRVVVEPVSSLCLNPANGWPTWCLLSPVSLMAPSQVVFHEEELLGSRWADPVTRLEVNVQAIRTIVTGPEGDNAAITDGSVLFTRALRWPIGRQSLCTWNVPCPPGNRDRPVIHLVSKLYKLCLLVSDIGVANTEKSLIVNKDYCASQWDNSSNL